MAEDVDDAKEDGAETDEAGGEAKKGGMKKLILFIGLPVVILLLAGVAGGLMFLGGGGDETHTAEAGHDGEGGEGDGHAEGGVDPGDMVAANFDSLHTWSGADGENMKITVNIRDETGRSVYLQVEFALVYTDPRLDAVLGREIVQTHLTDTYVEFLRSLRVEDIDGTMGSFRIRAEMQRRANLVLAPLEVEDVLLPALVIN